jgi:hypothetical protein
MLAVLCFYEREYYEKVHKKNLEVINGGGVMRGVTYNLFGE